ncbi:four-carbon acid sugar kinase family protein [Nonomuraea sp. K274]|uniref:Four-carbon acid sugar kinase family protein n=1 Tax=Nonomuraea cypriaca TaxID=1187855 RepID=A0A931A4J2_9ACTN|nr:four-carbon acid sugar kinase family protein [Nonomuraea cypriaca]MBF8184659.1 four-carbon acid sugar kinase family protein [Nonomuraea cypriaca]
MTRFAFVADDFTGATDALWQFRRFGLSGSLVTDVAYLHDRDDVIGVATTARASSDPADVVLPVFEALAALEPLVIQYKICSTFDSSPESGSIGAVIADLHRAGLAHGPVPVLAAQPELGRYTWFANHFVRAGDEVRRLDRHPPTRDHPVTPATEADLRVRLTEQGAGRTGWLPAVPSREAYLARGEDAAFVADALTDEHVRALGHLLLADAATRPPLVCVGSGGLSYALASADAASLPPDPVGGSLGRPLEAVGGSLGRPLEAVAPLLVVSGSRSPVTGRQIDTAERAGWRVLDVGGGASGSVFAEVEESLRSGCHTIVQSTRGPALDRDGIGESLGRVASAAVRAGLVRRLVIAGGDTSGQVVAALGARSLDVIALPAAGGPVCVLSSDDPACDGLEVALKGGQVGAPDYFLRAASATTA